MPTWGIARPAQRLRARLGRLAGLWARSTGGVAAVEFALVLPLMIFMLLGVTEVTYGVNVNRKLTLLSRSLADLSSRSEKMTGNEMQNIFSASKTIMMPYSSTQVGMTVSSVKVVGSGTTYTGSIAWSCNSGSNPTVRSVGSAYADIPDGFKMKDTTTYFMLVETKLPYNPIFGRALTGTLNLAETTPWPVRNNLRVEAPTSCTA